MLKDTSVLVRGARQLVTLRGLSGPRRGAALRELGIIQDGAVLIQDGVIAALGPSRRVENLGAARRAREIDASGCVVIPGFVDSHTHLVCGPPRLTEYEMRLSGASYLEIARAGGGILTSVRAVRETPIRRLVLQARQTLGGFIRHGTTTLEAKSGYGLDETGERKALRAVRALSGKPLDLIGTYLGAHVVPPEYAGRADDYLAWSTGHLMPKIRRRSLARFADVYCDYGAFTLKQARHYLEAAGALGFELKIHAEQFSNTGAAKLAVELGAVSADHLEQADDGDIEALAGSKTVATLLPGSVFHLGLERYAPARKMIEAGVAVALATDFNPGTSPSYSMQMMMSLACSQMRMTPAEALSAATINGAHAVRCADRAGSIEAGKNADLLVLNVPDYREIPYHFGVNLVAMTIKKGQVLYREGDIEWQDD
ncbi:MAG TPA: imidazolonepropionase [Bryobacteraceae bacterium]|nr:imidazolonepropionase [Bryobacteraceae bacterium]